MMLDRLVIVSGQGASDPETGELVGADVATQTEQVFRNMQRILEAAGSDLSRVLRCGVFLVDMRDFEAMNAVYARVFGAHRPARTTVQVSGLPEQGLRVEIDAIAYRP
jgi:2-iminobutanoate/2-iminopropanoate deaminase